MDNTIKLCMHRQSMLPFYSLSSISFIYNDFPIPLIQKPSHKKIILQTMFLVTLPAIIECVSFEKNIFPSDLWQLLHFVVDWRFVSKIKQIFSWRDHNSIEYWSYKFKWKEWHSFFTTPCRRQLSLLPFVY